MSSAFVKTHSDRLAAVEDRAMCGPSPSELELGAIIDAYNQVTEKLKASHDTLAREVGRLRDQLKQKDRELERKRRLAALGEMAAGVAHEVRNPLGGILLYAQMLENDLASQPEPQRVAGHIADAARKLDNIVSDILAFADRCELQCRPVSVEAVVRDVIDLLRPLWATAECTLTVEPCACEADVDADPSQLQRAFLNIIANAVQASGRGGRVWISFDRDAGEPASWVEVRVADDGPGVAAELRDRIFNPFFTTRDSGTGLGLAIAHRIVAMHSGSLTVSDRVDGGAVFTLRLPCAGGSKREEV